MRRATSSDFIEVADMARAFNNRYYDVPLCEDKLRGWFDVHLQRGVILLGTRSYISALLIEDPIRDYVAVVETGWYAEDGQGARLVLGLIKYAKENFADEVRMSTLKTSPTEAGTLLCRLGFEMNKECSHSLIL